MSPLGHLPVMWLVLPDANALCFHDGWQAWLPRPCVAVTAWLDVAVPPQSVGAPINLQDQDFKCTSHTYHANDVVFLVLEDSFLLGGGSLGRCLFLSPTAVSFDLGYSGPFAWKHQ